MTITSTKSQPKKPAGKGKTPAASGVLFVGQSTTGPAACLPVEGAAHEREPDLVTAFFNVLVDAHPALAEFREEGESVVRHRLKGLRGTVTDRPDSLTLQRRVLALFNGRNPREVARRLGVSRGTVYRMLKQAGRG